MSKSDLSLRPKYTRSVENGRVVEHDFWYYEQPNGLWVISRRAVTSYRDSRECLIPLRQIRSYLEALDAK